MNRLLKALVVGLVIVGMVFVGTFVVVAYADGLLPDGVEKYYPESGWFCIRDVELGVHFCEFIDPCCTQELGVECDKIYEATDVRETPEPVPTETQEPNDPTPEPPEPTDKPKCNAGGGNGSEGDPDCDPGNSGENNQAGD